MEKNELSGLKESFSKKMDIPRKLAEEIAKFYIVSSLISLCKPKPRLLAPSRCFLNVHSDSTISEILARACTL